MRIPKGLPRLSVLAIAAMNLCGCVAVTDSTCRVTEQPAAKEPASPSIAVHATFEPSEIQLGRQPWFSEVPFSTNLRNRTSSPLIITNIKTTCGCTVVKEGAGQRVAIGPDGSLEIHGTLSLREQHGPVHTAIKAYTESGFEISAAVIAESVPTFRVDPPSLVEFGQIDLTAGTSGTVRNVVFRSELVRLKGAVESDSAWLEAGRRDRGNGETEIAVHVIPRNLQYGRNVGRITIPLDDPHVPSWTLAIVADGYQPLRPEPSHVFLRGSEAQEVMFVASDGSRPRLTSAVPDTDRVAVEVRGDTIVVKNRTQKRIDDATLVLVTDGEGHRSSVLVSCTEP